MKKIFPLLYLIILTSCSSKKYPTYSKEFDGVVMTCKNDSSSMTIDTLIKIKRISHLPKGDCINCKYKDCENKPEYFDMLIHWPGNIVFDFKKKSYVFLTNSKPNNPKIKYGEKGFEVHYDLDFGTIDYNKKDKTFKLVSTKYDLTRNFIYSYSASESILTLKAINIR